MHNSSNLRLPARHSVSQSVSGLEKRAEKEIVSRLATLTASQACPARFLERNRGQWHLGCSHCGRDRQLWGRLFPRADGQRPTTSGGLPPSRRHPDSSTHATPRPLDAMGASVLEMLLPSSHLPTEDSNHSQILRFAQISSGASTL
jgi:hypothetical protein